MSEHLYLFALPRTVWEEDDKSDELGIGSFARDALACERRIEKEVNLETEHERYSLICQQLEQVVLNSARLRQVSDAQGFRQALQAGRFPFQALPPGYLALLTRTLASEGKGRLGASFFPPDQIAAHRELFEHWATAAGLQNTPVVQQRLDFLEMASRFDCGVVEVQSAFQRPKSEQQEATANYGYAPAVEEDAGQFVDIPDFVTTGDALEPFGNTGRKAHLARILRSQIRKALEMGELVAFGNQAPHDVIAEVLNEFVFVPPGKPVQPVELRIIYADGSEADPIPLFCLPHPEEPTQEIEPLRAALMSMRHSEMDPLVDLYWFRNREVSRTRTLAETDQFCYETTMEQLEESLALGDLSLHLYHTGFEPAVLGFYRGVVRILLRQREQIATASLSVTPFYYRGDHYQTGSLWG